MIKQSLMAAVVFLCATHAFANNINSTDCIFSDVNFSQNADLTINPCGVIPALQTQAIFELSKDSDSDVIAPLHVKHKNSSLAEAITVVLFIPGLILLLFSGFTKSAK